MKSKQLTVKQSLNKACRLIKPDSADIEKFKAKFNLLLCDSEIEKKRLFELNYQANKNSLTIPARYIATKLIFFMTGNNLKYLLSIRNSKLAKWYFNQISTSSGMGTKR
jgi:hypothetical protein